MFRCVDLVTSGSWLSDTRRGRDRLIKIKVILEKRITAALLIFGFRIGTGSVSFCLGWTGMASLPAKSLVCQMEIWRVGQGPSGERPEHGSSRKVLYLSQPAEEQPFLPSQACEEPLNIWDWEEVSPSSPALVIPLMGSKLWGLPCHQGNHYKAPRDKVGCSTKDWLCLWTEQVLSFIGYSLDDWEVFLWLCTLANTSLEIPLPFC